MPRERPKKCQKDTHTQKILLSMYEHVHVNFFCVCVFLTFLGPLPWHMGVPRLGVESEL